MAQRGGREVRDGRAADSLLTLGRLASAESAYYADSRVSPRDPDARARLGMFLAARGATRVGVVLLEEARDFGGDSARLARDLAPMYVRLGDHRALLGLTPNVLTPVERRRFEWLVTHPTRVGLTDSVMRIPYRASTRGPGFGTVLVRVGRTELAAAIDPDVVGLRLPAVLRRDLVTFDSATAVATIRIGALAMENVPTTLAPPGEDARVGFDLLAAYSPTFDPGAERVTLRRPDRRWRPPAGTRVPALFDQAGIRLLFRGGWQQTTAASVVRLLASRRWTWDARRGDVVLLTP